MPSGADLNVTTYKLDGATNVSMARAINRHLTELGIEPQEYGYSACSIKPGQTEDLPKRYRWLLSFAVEGGSEGYYCHVGMIIPAPEFSTDPTTYVDICFCKTWDQESANTIAAAVQRFCVNAEWN